MNINSMLWDTEKRRVKVLSNFLRNRKEIYFQGVDYLHRNIEVKMKSCL